MTPAIRGGMSLGSMILIAGSIVLLFFVILSGVKNTTPLNKIWFLQADTSRIAGSGRALSQWTYFYVCGADNQDCGAAVPDLPIGYAWIGGSDGVPADLVGTHGKDTTSRYYYYMWRFGWVFYLMALVFDILAFSTSLLAPCSRLASGLSGLILAIALFWMTLAASLMTAVFVKAHNEFRSADISSSIGRYAFGFTWGAWAAIFLATIMLFISCGLRDRKDSARTTNQTSFFHRQRSTRSRRSVFNNESQRRVKDEYA